MTPEEFGLPWHFVYRPKSDLLLAEDNSLIMLIENPIDGQINLGDKNANFIIHAVNNFFAMREALRDLLEDTQHTDHDCGDTIENCAVLKAKAVLKAAEQWESV